MTIAVDFDGTIVEHKYPAIGRELPFAFEILKKFTEEGHRVILWTVRRGHLLEEAVDFCRRNGLEFYAVNSDYPDGSWETDKASRKITADIYIDDRNLGGIPDWNMIYQMVANHLTYQDMLDKMECEESPVIYDGTYRRPSGHSHHHRKGIFARLSDRCREARNKYRH